MKKIIFSICAVLFVACLFATETEWVTLKGKVVDAHNQSVLIGAKVVIGDSEIVAYTDPDGFFDIDVPLDELGHIQISYISYEERSYSLNEVSEELVFELSPR
ncbi:MAG: carboxypeptidase-like regulatory domain-containing protein [Bacteroidota bacterium]